MGARGTPRARSPNIPLLRSLGVLHRIERYPRAAVIFAQGGAATEVMYLQPGVGEAVGAVSNGQREAIISVLQAWEFFGEGCFAGQSSRMATAVAVNASMVAIIDKHHVIDMMHRVPELNDH